MVNTILGPQGAYCLPRWRIMTVLVVCCSNHPSSSRTCCKHLLLESMREFTRQPNSFLGCFQQMAEHCRSARAGPFLPSVGLLCGGGSRALQGLDKTFSELYSSPSLFLPNLPSFSLSFLRDQTYITA